MTSTPVTAEPSFLSSGARQRSVSLHSLHIFYEYFQVLNFTRFSSKSDVWAYGVLCWEVFTCGDMPYGRAKNPEVVERVQRGQILGQPSDCPNKVYEVMRLCWATLPEDRPSFRTIKEKLTVINQDLNVD